jgi:hypothetical protein
MDEWTDICQNRYFLIMLHDYQTTYNVGLIPIPPESCDAHLLERMIFEKIDSLDLTMDDLNGINLLGRFCIFESLHVCLPIQIKNFHFSEFES